MKPGPKTGVIRRNFVNSENADDGYSISARTFDAELETLHVTNGYDNMTGMGTPNGDDVPHAVEVVVPQDLSEQGTRKARPGTAGLFCCSAWVPLSAWRERLNYRPAGMSERARESLRELEEPGGFVRRHIGPGADEQRTMLDALGYESLDALVDAAVPDSIRDLGPRSRPSRSARRRRSRGCAGSARRTRSSRRSSASATPPRSRRR